MKYTSLLLMLGAIPLEVVGTTSLKLAGGMERPLWYIPVIIAWSASLFLFSTAVKVIPLGIAYAMWAGLGIFCTTLIGTLAFHQKLTLTSIIGIFFILGGAILVSLQPDNSAG